MRSYLSASGLAAVAVVLALVSVGASIQPEATLHLRIHQPDGKPAAGAQAIAFGPGPGQTVYIQDAKFYPGDVEPITADDGGAVKLQALKDQQRLVVAHDSGFALLSSREVETLKDGVIKLQAYGRIEGRLLIGADPGPEGSSVGFQHYPQDQQLMQSLAVFYYTTTDAEGRFAFERIWPGAGLLTHHKLIDQGGVGTQLNLISVSTSVAANETTRSQIGGSGRPVVGKVVLPERARGWMIMATLAPRRRMPEPQWPEEAAAWTQEQKNEFRNNWFATPEGLAAVKAIAEAGHKPVPCWMFDIDKEDRITANDVEPGEYQLLISAMEPGSTVFFASP